MPVKCSKCKGYGHESANCKKEVLRIQKVWKPKQHINPEEISKRAKEQICNAEEQQNTHVCRKDSQEQTREVQVQNKDTSMVATNQYATLESIAEEEITSEEQVQEMNQDSQEMQENGQGIESAVVLPVPQRSLNMNNTRDQPTQSRRMSGKNPISDTVDNG